jgi:hypothetical protein
VIVLWYDHQISYGVLAADRNMLYYGILPIAYCVMISGKHNTADRNMLDRNMQDTRSAGKHNYIRAERPW